MKIRLTFPMLWVLLTLMWLLLYQSAAPAHWLLGASVAYAAVSLYALLQSPIKNVVGALQSGGQTVAGLVKTLSER